MRVVFLNFHYLVCSITIIFKLSNEFLNHDKVRYLYKAMENHWNVFTSEFEMHILKDYSILSQKVIKIYAITLYCMVTLYIILPFKPIILDVISPLNESRPRRYVINQECITYKDKYFVPLLCYYVTALVTAVTIFIGIETIYVTRIIHACSLFSIISQQFKRITSQVNIYIQANKRKCYMNALINSASEPLLHDEYIICLKKYQLAVKFTNALNSMYQIVTLISLFSAGSTISLDAIQIVYELDQFDQLLIYITIITGSTIQLMILCYPGQKLLDASQNVFYQVYDMEWYTFSPKLKSLIIITLHKSLVPCGLTAGSLCSISMGTFATILALYNNWKNRQIVFESFYHAVCIVTFIAKLSNEICNYNKTWYLYEAIENHWNTFTCEFELSTLKNYSVLSQKFAILYSITIYFMTIIFIMTPFKPILLDIIWSLNESRTFAIDIAWPLDMDKYFIPIFCFIMIGMSTAMMISVSVETIYVTRTIHACSLFSIISQQFGKILKMDVNIEVSEHIGHGFDMNSLSAFYKLTNEQVIYEKYVICLKKYQLILEFVDVLNSMYRILTLMLLLYAVVTISLVGIKILDIFDQFEELLKYILAIIASLMQLAIVCYPNQKMLDESQNVFYQIYDVEWYTFSPRLKKLLIITLQRSFVPCGLTVAGNLCSLSMATFAAVIRMGMSFFTTFLSLKN